MFLLISSAARVVLATEHGMQLPAAPDKAAEQLRKYFSASDDKLQVFGKEEWLLKEDFDWICSEISAKEKIPTHKLKKNGFRRWRPARLRPGKWWFVPVQPARYRQ